LAMKKMKAQKTKTNKQKSFKTGVLLNFSRVFLFLSVESDIQISSAWNLPHLQL